MRRPPDPPSVRSRRLASAAGFLLLVAPAALVGCGSPSPGDEKPRSGGPDDHGAESEPAAGGAAPGRAAGDSDGVATEPGGPPAVAPDERRLPRVVFLGDSLTAGYGLGEEQAFPALLGELLAAEGTPIRVVNAGVSGDTSAGGLARLDWVLRQKPDQVVVELGPNDGLRGLPLEMTEKNLREIIARCRATGARVLLVGMQIPPNYGPEYSGAFGDLYPRLARELDLPLVPFLLDGVGGEPDLNLPDGLHPNAEGHKIVARNVLPYLRELVAARRAPPPQ